MEAAVWGKGDVVRAGRELEGIPELAFEGAEDSPDFQGWRRGGISRCRPGTPADAFVKGPEPVFQAFVGAQWNPFRRAGRENDNRAVAFVRRGGGGGETAGVDEGGAGWQRGLDVAPGRAGRGLGIREHGIQQAGLGGDENVGDELGIAGGAGQRDEIEAFEEIEALVFGALADQAVEQIQADPGGADDVVVRVGRGGEQRVAGEVALGFRDAEMSGGKVLGLEGGRAFEVDAGGRIVTEGLLGDAQIVQRADQAGMIGAESGLQHLQRFLKRGFCDDGFVLGEGDAHPDCSHRERRGSGYSRRGARASAAAASVPARASAVLPSRSWVRASWLFRERRSSGS